MAQGMLGVLVKQAKAAASDKKPFDVLKKNLYGIEALSRRHLLTAEKMQQRYKRFVAKHKRPFPPISLMALREYRTTQGWPTFAVFNLNSPQFSIIARAQPARFLQQHAFGTVLFDPELPDGIAACYDDIGQNLLQRSQRLFAAA